MIYTFYSYKGGVGRSMALANVAELFYQAGLKVLMLDWDLEAPGLERFFPIDHTEFYTKSGIIDLLLNYKQKMTEEIHLNDTDELPFDQPEQFLFDIYPDSRAKGKLWLLSAGKRSKFDFSKYASHVKNFGWKDFYENWEGELYIEWLRRQFERIADVVLIDSRTGVSEMGGVCTYQLADVIVMLSSASQQSLDGTHHMFLQFKHDRVKKIRNRPLDVIVVPAKIEYAESNYLDAFQEEFIELFNDIPEKLGSRPDRFWQLCIPYTPKYAYKERLAIPEKDKAHAKHIVEAFSKLASALSVFAEENSRIRVAMPGKTISFEGGNLSRIEVTKDIIILDDNIYIEKNPRGSDWGNAPDGKNFFGRVKELNELEKWIIQDRCRMVAILGMGGVGKTDFSLKLAKRIEEEFDYVIWRSLRDAQPINDLLEDVIKYLSNQTIVSKDSQERQFSHLLNYLRSNRCLLILDNVEAVLKAGETAGDYRDTYEGYGQLFKLIGETNHQSCLLLTSRETPREIIQLSGKIHPTRLIELKGLNLAEGRELSESVIGTLIGKDKEWEDLVNLYDGHPLALELSVRYIHDVFGDQISDFLKEHIPVFEDLKNLLDEHFNRLSEEEKEIMYWLAINREPVSIQGLIDDFNIDREFVSFHDLITDSAVRERSSKVRFHIRSLKRRFPLEERKGAGLTLQSVILEYTTEKLIDKICQEIENGEFKLLNHHALIKATAKDYIRKIQIRLILEPIINKLLKKFGSSQALENRIAQILSQLRETSPLRSGYVGGNLLNLLVKLKNSDLTGYNFSRLNICQANLQNVKLHGANFTEANFTKSSFTEAFSSLLSVAFSPQNGQYLATGDADGRIRLWRVNDLSQCSNVDAHSSWVRSVTFSPDGTMIASGSDDQTVKLWKFDQDEGFLPQDPIAIFNDHTYRVRSVAFNPRDSNMLASSSYDHTVRLWNIKTGKCQILKEHTDWVWTAVFSQDGTKLVSSSKDKTLKIWDVVTGRCISTWQVSKIDNKDKYKDIQSACFSFNDEFLAVGCDDKTVKLFDFKELLSFRSGDSLRFLDEHTKYVLKDHADYVRSVAFNSKGELASASYDNTIKLWNIEKGECKDTLPGHTHRLRSIAFTPDGKTLVSGGWDKTLKLWKPDEGNESLRTLQSCTDWICGADISPDGKLLVSGSDEKVIKFWDVSKGQVVSGPEEHTNWIWTVAFSPDGKLIASGSFDRTIILWNSHTREPLHPPLLGHQTWVWTVAFSSDGKLLASGGDEPIVKIWEVATGKLLESFNNTDSKWIRSVAFSPDSKFLAVGSDDGKIRIWDIKNPSEPNQILLGHEKRVRSVVFSPNGKTLASASYDCTVKIWDVSTEKLLRTLSGHQQQVRSVAFSRDGKVLASGGNDRTVRLWNPNTGECFKVLDGDNGHTDEVRSVAFSRNENVLISSSKDGTIRLWTANTGKFIKCIREPRPYEGMNINKATGLSDLQKASLIALGSVEN